MTIRSMEKFNAGLWDWEFIDRVCFPTTRIRIGDLDGCVERGGEILILEGKPAGYLIRGGQAGLYRTFAKKDITVLILFGYAANPLSPTIKTPCQMQVWYPGEQRPEEITPCDESEAQHFVWGWFRWATYKRWRDLPSFKEYLIDTADMRLPTEDKPFPTVESLPPLFRGVLQ